MRGERGGRAPSWVSWAIKLVPRAGARKVFPFVERCTRASVVLLGFVKTRGEEAPQDMVRGEHDVGRSRAKALCLS